MGSNTKSIVVKNKERKPPMQKVSEYEEFILWHAMPAVQKVQMGLETQYDFAMHYKVAPETLSRWKDRADFRSRVKDLRDKWAFEKTHHVIEAIYKSALKGNDKSQKLWMQVFEGFTEKQETTHKIQKVEIGVNDVRHIIELLPEPLRSKHYANLRELIDDANAIRDARRAEDARWDTPIEGAISESSNNDAQDVSGEGSDEISARYTPSVCEDMERKVSPYNHQSAAWWWQE